MNVLAPWFLAGLALLAGPIIAHLIRRSTRERVAFSALRMLDESAPRLDRRSRVQHPWLLALRCLIVATLVLGFARPYLRFAAANDAAASRERRHVVAILDESASMQRAGLWTAARQRVSELVADLDPNDRFVLLGAGVGATELIGADTWAATAPRDRRGLVETALADREPGWGPTPLDSAIESALSHWEELAEADETAARRELVIISDFTAGARLAGLASIDWPANAEVVLDQVTPEHSGNASLQWLGWTSTSAGTPAARVRVARSFDTPEALYWQLHDAQTGRPLAPREPLEVLPGASQTRVVPWPENASDTLRLNLTGDEEPFDNRVWMARPRVRGLSVHYLGSHSADDPQHSHFYLKRAIDGWQEPKARLTTDLSAESTAPALIIVDEPLDAAATAQLRTRLATGSFAIVLLAAESNAAARLETAAALAGESGWRAIAPARSDGLLLGQLDFRHPLFAPFADPLYSDFTRIRFWQPQPVELPPHSTASVVARFDDGSAAVLEIPVGQGRLTVWASGWSPAASQWVLSSKFVPWLQALAERTLGGVRRPTVAEIGDPARLGSLRPLATAAGAATASPAAPGIYTTAEGDEQRHVALNVPAAESQLEPLSLEVWEQLGVPLRTPASTVSIRMRAQQQRAEAAAALENRQQAWRWLLGLAAGLLVLESLIAGRLSRGTSAHAPEWPP